MTVSGGGLHFTQISIRNVQKHEAVKFRLRRAGTSLAEISRTLGVGQSATSAVSLGDRRSRRIEAAIAEVLKTTPEALWPERYKVKRGDRA
ncbi:helix-turn-helix domain-containing protein [Halocynthiibacter sp.]|uniref:helix-turn-helix domain-containing protein n=1 Tax=Halocynthiibacter sp. TaxID=1979210 RepID=UPI003C491AFE